MRERLYSVTNIDKSPQDEITPRYHQKVQGMLSREKKANSDEDSDFEDLEPILSLPEQVPKSASRKRRFSYLSGETPADNTVEEYRDSARLPPHGIPKATNLKYLPVADPIHDVTGTVLTTHNNIPLSSSCASTCQPSKEDPQIQTQHSSWFSTMEPSLQHGIIIGPIDIDKATLTHRHRWDLYPRIEEQ